MIKHAVLFKRLIFLWLLSYTSLSMGALNIEITKGVTGAVPVAVLTEHHAQTAQASFEELAQIIRNDLRTSGRFAPLLPYQMPRKAPNEIAPTWWQELSVENLITGTVVAVGPDRYDVTFKLYDVFKMQPNTQQQKQVKEGELVISKDNEAGLITAKTYHNISEQRFRTLAHHISDVIYEQLTGVRGAFSTQIAYVVVTPIGRKNTYRLEVADVDGYQPKTLVESREPIMSPSWSPDGRQLAFVSFEKNRAEIYVLDITSGQRKLLTRFPGINGAPAWSPDGRQLALVLSKDGSPNIYTLDIASRRLHQVTYGYAIDTEPTWTPDGQTLFFTSNRGGKPQIYKVDLTSKKTSRVTYHGNYNARPKLTPDGRQLVMIHRSQPGVFHIASQNLVNGEVKILTDSKLDESPSLSPNGAMILYGTKEGERRVLGLVTIDGRGHLRLPAREGSVQEPAWSPYLS